MRTPTGNVSSPCGGSCRRAAEELKRAIFCSSETNSEKSRSVRTVTDGSASPGACRTVPGSFFANGTNVLGGEWLPPF